MTADTLKDYNKKNLAQMAKEQGISGWHAMRKDQLIRALTVTRSSPSSRSRKLARSAKKHPATRSKALAPRKQSASATETAVAARRSCPSSASAGAALALPHTLDHACQKDRIIVLARNPYWLHAYWELSRTTLARAQAALGQEWHSAQPILRVMDVTSEDTTTSAERQVRDIPIHGGVNNWYIDVLEPPRAFRIDIGYLSRRSKFYVLARSNIVSTPKAGVTDALDENWSDVQQQFERVQNPSSIGCTGVNSVLDLRDLFEERLRRPLSSASMQNLSVERAAQPGPEFPLRDRCRADRLRYHRAKCPCDLAGRTGSSPLRRNVHGPFQLARFPADYPRGCVEWRWRRGTNDRAGRRAQHQGARTNDPR